MIIETTEQPKDLVLYYQGISECEYGYPQDMWEEEYDLVRKDTEFPTEYNYDYDRNNGDLITMPYPEGYWDDYDLSDEVLDYLRDNCDPVFSEEQRRNIYTEIESYISNNYKNLNFGEADCDLLCCEGLIRMERWNDCDFGYCVWLETNEQYSEDVINQLAIDILHNVAELQTLYFEDKDSGTMWELPTMFKGYRYE